ncbi:MAG: YjdF family protein [Clostridia bacterium]|nr:YjdF family protein [Clostridia bacterium]
METVQISVTVCFEEPFWVGIFERAEGGRLQAARIVFGAEPRDAEVFSRILTEWTQLHFSLAVAAGGRQTADSPRRRRRAAVRAVEARGTSTRSQRALAAQREMRQAEQRRESRERRADAAERRFEARQKKRKEKRRGH